MRYQYSTEIAKNMKITVNYNKHICIVVQSHYETDARIQREVSALTKEGYKVDIICLSSSSIIQLKDDVTLYGISLGRKRGSVIRYIYEYSIFTILAGWRVFWLMLKHRYSVIQVCNLPDILILAALLPKFLGAKIVFDAHEGAPEAFLIHKGGRFYSKPCVKLAIWIEKLAFKLADEVITVHEVMKRRFILRGANPEKISVIRNLPSLQIFKRRSDLDKRKKEKNFTLLYTGSITPPYGLHIAIQSLPLLSDIPHLKLRIVGFGNSQYKETLCQLAEKLGVLGQVSFESPVPQAQVPSLYSDADIGISPHTGGVFGEICFSNKVLEYLACGLPAVVSRTPVYEYYFSDSELAFCKPDDPVSFAEQVRKIYIDHDYCRRLIMHGVQRIKELNWENEQVQYINLVNRLAI